MQSGVLQNHPIMMFLCGNIVYLVKIWCNAGVGRIVDEAIQGAIHSIINVVDHSVGAVFFTIWKKIHEKELKLPIKYTCFKNESKTIIKIIIIMKTIPLSIVSGPPQFQP